MPSCRSLDTVPCFLDSSVTLLGFSKACLLACRIQALTMAASGSIMGAVIAARNLARRAPSGDRRAIWEAWEATAACPGANVDYPLALDEPETSNGARARISSRTRKP